MEHIVFVGKESWRIGPHGATVLFYFYLSSFDLFFFLNPSLALQIRFVGNGVTAVNNGPFTKQETKLLSDLHR